MGGKTTVHPEAHVKAFNGSRIIFFSNLNPRETLGHIAKL